MGVWSRGRCGKPASVCRFPKGLWAPASFRRRPSGCGRRPHRATSKPSTPASAPAPSTGPLEARSCLSRLPQDSRHVLQHGSPPQTADEANNTAASPQTWHSGRPVTSRAPYKKGPPIALDAPPAPKIDPRKRQESQKTRGFDGRARRGLHGLLRNRRASASNPWDECSRSADDSDLALRGQGDSSYDFFRQRELLGDLSRLPYERCAWPLVTSATILVFPYRHWLSPSSTF